MEFLHGYLLGGLALIGVPILVHLITREKPKKLVFPAFRFLRQNYLTNRRKLQFHHLLLLLLRILVIGFLCLALAQPWLTDERLILFGRTQPVHAVFLIDTTPSMEFERGDVSRLEDARRRAREVIEVLPKGSEVCVLDTSGTADPFVDKEEVEPFLRRLDFRPGGGRVTRQFGEAFRLLKEQAEKQGNADVPQYVYIFSDRTRASWDRGDLGGLPLPEGVVIVYVDVGTDKVTDISLDNIIVDPPAVAPGGTVEVRVTVRSIGAKARTKVLAQLVDGTAPLERTVEIPEDGKQDIAFQFQAAPEAGGNGLKPGSHQVVLSLEGVKDQLPFNDARYATFVVRQGRKVLTLMDEPNTGESWHIALDVLGFTSHVRALRDLARLDLAGYDMICLFQAAAPTQEEWKILQKYVSNDGRRLAIVPPGEVGSYKSDEAAKLLPARLEEVITTPNDFGISWKWDAPATSALMDVLSKWRRERGDVDFQRPNGKPTVRRYWKVLPADGARVISQYEDDKGSPALVERKVGAGKVLLFTTKLSPRLERLPQGLRPWSNYWYNSFGLVLTDLVCRYLAGDSVVPDWNLLSGDTIEIPLSSLDENLTFRLEGPGLPGKGHTLTAPPPTEEQRAGKKDRTLPVDRAELAGNYRLFQVEARKETPFAAFSLNVRPAESQLVPRLPKEDVESLLGKDSVLDMEHGVSLKDVVARKPKPLPLLPYLLAALVLFVALETFIANRRRDALPAEGKLPDAPPAMSPLPAGRAAVHVLAWSALGAVAGTLLGMLRTTSDGIVASIVTTTLLGTSHGLVSIARFTPRDSAILGGLLGSMVGVLYGWLVLGSLEEFDTAFAVLAGMVLGASVMAVDGWFVGRRGAG